ncbi:D-glycerate 3-kinase, plant type [Pseudanabaena sp. lw0831]|uniref:glycerate kinase n=1 Tax=Pseudanabaena sp. lw0831 TaxID=1357935 RepID=UPI00191583D7|nr:glycerate kinase [Pseudanabaena sp. lw0831]GBO52337.1 D-glycerate 3-kinase, plant type [Pseudanabaena sp. lw0831]
MIKSIPIRIFELIIRGDRLSSSDYDLLMDESRNNSDYFCALDIGALDLNTFNEIVDQRSQLLRSVYPKISQVLAIHNIQIDPPSAVLPLLWHYWLPLAQSLASQQEKIGRTFIQGLLGGQGTGKTTLGIVLNILLGHLGKTFLSISLDDLYKTYAERQKLRDRHPDFIWRGPPSTHDVDLGIQVLQQLRDRHLGNSQLIEIPRFDKSLHNGAGDRTEPEISHAADIVLFEGWFVGMCPLPISALRNFVPPILSEGDLEFAHECNANLYNYLPLWEYLDSLIVLVPEDYKYSLEWRIEAEHKLIAAGKSGMNDQEITQFVEYFWKALHPELFMPRMINRENGGSYADLVVEISRSHLPTNIYSLLQAKGNQSIF